MDLTYTFGYKLAELTKQNEIACVGLFCLAVKDAGKNIHKMVYQDYETVIRIYLPKRLEKINVTNVAEIITEMEETLKLKQSVITMSVR